MAITDKVTPTEYKIMGQLACGLCEKEIAAKNFVSPKTIKAHTYNIRRKLNARCAADLVRMFILDLEDPKKYFAAMCFVLIQGFMITNQLPIDMRKPHSVSVRMAKGAKRKVS